MVAHDPFQKAQTFFWKKAPRAVCREAPLEAPAAGAPSRSASGRTLVCAPPRSSCVPAVKRHHTPTDLILQVLNRANPVLDIIYTLLHEGPVTHMQA